MKILKLTQGYEAKISDDDFGWASKLSWFIVKKKYKLYAKTSIKGEAFYLHRLITKMPYVDHVDGDGLNNQKINLRECTHAQNMANRRYHNKTGYKGVYKIKNIDGIEYYQAKIKVGKKDIYLGSSYDKKKLAILYNDAAVKYFGEFARLNIID